MGAAWLSLSIVFIGISLSSAFFSISHQAHQQLDSQMPERLNDALRYSPGDSDAIANLASLINADLEQLRIESRVPVINQCRIDFLGIGDAADKPAPVRFPIEKLISVDWAHGMLQETAQFRLSCELAPLPVLGVHSALALLAVLMLFSMPASLGSTERDYLLALNGLGLKHQLAHRVILASSPLTARQQARLALVISRARNGQLAVDDIPGMVATPDTITFSHATHSVTVLGINIVLSKTPYFYYAMYAHLRKQNGEGWVLNPAIDRPDPQYATLLLDLMNRFGGHQKAVNDLRDHGVRAKILDQNRNKIKDELTGCLGETLACDFLFETRRDNRSGRHLYRIKCPPERIIVNT